MDGPSSTVITRDAITRRKPHPTIQRLDHSVDFAARQSIELDIYVYMKSLARYRTDRHQKETQASERAWNLAINDLDSL